MKQILIKGIRFVLIATVYFNSNILLADHKEIRPDKTIRLGGYFYRCWKGKNGDMSPEQMMWVANYLDIISSTPNISKNTITKIKEINHNMKYYIMTFATTLFDNRSKKSRWPSFDAKIMNDWVIRLKNGKEAIGVRRESDDSKAHIMDLGSAEWADFFRNYYSQLVKDRCANGVAIDEIMWNGYWGVKISEMAKYSSTDEIRKTAYDWLKRIASPPRI